MDSYRLTEEDATRSIERRRTCLSGQSEFGRLLVYHDSIPKVAEDIWRYWRVPNTTDTENRLAPRLRAYAGASGVGEAEVVSLKLRPVMPGAQYADPFGHQDANAYMYDSEYRAGRGVCDLRPLGSPMDGRNLHVGHPLPWSTDANDFVRSLENVRQGTSDGRYRAPAVWIQHETGLEILFVLAAVLGLVTAPFTLFQAYEAIRSKVSANTKDGESDRHYKDVNRIRVELRQLERGELRQELVVSQETHEPFDPGELARIVKSIVRTQG